LGPELLDQLLKLLPTQKDPRLLVGTSTCDDAGVYLISDELALIQTVDFFPPIIDDPYDFGRIAVANALSDVYAMGGDPLTALNIVCFPSSSMGIEVLTETLRGGVDKLNEAGALAVGGHSVDDKEFKYGVAVTGTVHPNKILTNATARPGDKLILTKPLGTGVVGTAIKAGQASDQLIRKVTDQMAELNCGAMHACRENEITCATDVTGLGLLGHANEIACASGVTLRIEYSAVPVLPEALDLLTKGIKPGGLDKNSAFLKDRVLFAGRVPASAREILFDPQTSGGFLISVAEDRTDDIIQSLKNNGVNEYGVVGEVIHKAEKSVEVLP
jgi:selenide,water dikinase